MTENDRWLDIGQRLSNLETVIENMDRRLFGNGQPGELSVLAARIGKMEKWCWRAAGAIGVIIVFWHNAGPLLKVLSK